MSALVIVDVQNDFVNGSLAVPGAEAIFSKINSLLNLFTWDLKIFTQDWHPSNHISFAKTHGKQVQDTISVEGKEIVLWPVHCVQNTFGAQIHEAIDTSKATHFVRKGFEPDVECLSALRDIHGKKDTSLVKILRENKINSLYIVGLALDYCVVSTIVDALEYGFAVKLFLDATKPVSEQGGQRALERIQDNTVECITTEQFTNS